VAWHGCDMLWCHTKGAWCAMKEPIVPHWVWAHWISGWSFFSWIMSSPAFGFWLALWMKERVVDVGSMVGEVWFHGSMFPCWCGGDDHWVFYYKAHFAIRSLFGPTFQITDSV
jgi:hypothetical protein